MGLFSSVAFHLKLLSTLTRSSRAFKGQSACSPFLFARDPTASSLSYEDLPYEESLSFAVRVDVTGRVCTTNEGKKGGQVRLLVVAVYVLSGLA
jgi:hypothetical protein